MTLQERFEMAAAQARRAHQLEQQRSAAKKVEEKAKQLQTLRLSLEHDRGRREALRSHGFPVPWPDPTKIRNAIVALKATVESGAGGTAEYGKLTRALGKFAEEASEPVSLQVTAALKSLQNDATELKGLRDVDGYAQQVHALLRDVEALAAHEWKRADAAALGLLLAKRKALLKRIDPLVHADVPESVRTFFTAARGDGAALKLLTDEVKEWLKKNNHLDKVKLVLK